MAKLDVSKPSFSDLEFSSLIGTLEMKLLSAKPKATSPYWNLSKPYSGIVWQSIAGSLLFTMAATSFVQGLEWKALIFFIKIPPYGNTYSYSGRKALMWILAPIASQCALL